MDTASTFRLEDSLPESFSLLQLDPSPIDTPTPTEADKELFASTEGSEDDGAVRTSSATTRGPSRVGGHGAIYYLSRIQRYSSYAVSVFTSLHLANVSLIPAVTRSVLASETYLLMTREIYQTTISEPLIVGLPVLAHVGSGVALRILRRWQNKARYGGAAPSAHEIHGTRRKANLWPQLSYISMSGYAFTVFYAAHAFVNRGLPLLVDGDSSNIGLAYVSHGFARHPVVSRLAYMGLIVIGCGHMVWGAAKWLSSAPSTRSLLGAEGSLVDKKVKKRRRRQWLGLHGVVVTIAALWGVGGMGVVAEGGPADGWVGKLYDDMFSRIGL